MIALGSCAVAVFENDIKLAKTLLEISNIGTTHLAIENQTVVLRDAGQFATAVSAARLLHAGKIRKKFANDDKDHARTTREVALRLAL